jgi:hypothetical protein
MTKFGKGFFVGAATAAALLLPVQLATGATTVTTRTVTVRGSSSCADWIQDRKRLARKDKDDLYYFTSAQSDLRWIMGYLSGLNESSSTKRDLLGDFDAEIANDFIDAYCRNHPRDQVFQGVNELYKRLNN